MPKRPYDSHYWRTTLRPAIYQRDGGMCQICAVPHPVPLDAFDIDHIIPWGPPEHGEWYDPTNLRLSCPEANRGRSSVRRARRQPAKDAPVYPGPSRDW